MLRFGQQQKGTSLPVSKDDFKPRKNRVNKQKKVGLAVIVSVVLFLIWTLSGKSSEKEPIIQKLTEEELLNPAATGKKEMAYRVDANGVETLNDRKSTTDDDDSDESGSYNVEFYDLNQYQGSTNSKENGDIVLLCIPLRNAEAVLPLMFRNMMNMTYYHDLIDIAFLVSDCSEGDKTLDTLFEYSQAMQKGKLLELLDSKDKAEKASGISGSSDLYLSYMPTDYIDNVKQAYSPPYHDEYSKPFRSIQVYQKDFGQVIGQGFSDRHDVKIQGIRRKLMGRARNWLVTTALKPYHSWVYWRDADIETSPGEILENLMRFSGVHDVLVPNVWRPLPTFLGNEQPYDLNSWIESEQGLELAKTIDEDDVIVEGYAEYPTWRVHLAYIRDPNGNQNEIVDLDGVGGVSILAKAKVFRQGSNFPAFTFMNHAETEAFGKLSKAMGFRVGGLPHYTIWHIYEPSEDDLLQISMMERKKRRNRNRKEE